MRVIRDAARSEREHVVDLWRRCGLQPVADDEWESLITRRANALLVAE